MTYANSAPQVRYIFNQLAGDTLDQDRHFFSEETGALDCVGPNTFLGPLKIAYDNPDWVRMAAREICALKQKNQLFSAYLASFKLILGDMHWDDKTIEGQLYPGLSEELKDALSLHGSQDGNLKTFIANSKNLDNRVRARNEERKPTRGTTPILSFPAPQPEPKAERPSSRQPSYSTSSGQPACADCLTNM